MNGDIADTRQRLTELNRLEEENVMMRRAGRSTLDSEALMESLRANLSFKVLAHRDRLRTLDRFSVAEVRQGVCSGCKMPLPSATRAGVRRQKTLVLCDHCGRFIFPSEEPASAAILPAMEKPLSRRAGKR